MYAIQNHQSKTMLVFKTNTLEFELTHTANMVSYQGMPSGLPLFLVGVNSALSRFSRKNDCLEKPDFSYFSNWKRQCQKKSHDSSQQSVKANISIQTPTGNYYLLADL